MHKANVYKMPHAWNVSKHEKKKNLNKRIVMSKVLRAFPCEIQVHLWDYTSICISIVQGCSRKHNYKSKYFGKQ